MPSSYSQYAAGVANLAQTKAVPCLVLPGGRAFSRFAAVSDGTADKAGP